MWSTLSAGEALAMLDMEVRFLRPVPADGGELAIAGRVVHGGRTVGAPRLPSQCPIVAPW